MIKSTKRRFMLVALVALTFGSLTACNNNNAILAALLGPFNLAAFPVALTGAGNGGFGNITLDRNGDLIAVSGYGTNLYTIARADGALTTLAMTGTAGDIISVVDTGTAVYVGSSNGNIYSVDTGTGAATLFATVGAQDIQALVVAPASFGAFGGQLITGDRNGDVNAVDAVGTVTFIATVANLTNLAFAADGTLYVTDDGAGNLSTVTAAGVDSVFAVGLANADGIAIDNAGGRIFVFSPGVGINSVAVPGGAVTFVNNLYLLDNGYWPGGAFFDAPGGDLFIMTDTAPDSSIETFKP